MSQSPEDEEKAKALQKKQTESSVEKTESSDESSSPKPSTPVTRPSVGTPIGRPVVGAPVGTKGSSSGTSAPKPAVSTTVGSPPRVGVSVGKTAGPTGVPGKPTVPQKPSETKQEVSRRNFLKILALVGGLVMVGSFGPLFPFLQGSVESVNATSQVITDDTGAPIRTADIPQNGFKIFIWPKTGNAAIDADSFRQCVAIHLPSNLSASSDVSAKDPVSGDTFIAFSRVCVHLWCLWNYIARDERMECPCHGSQYVPGTGQYPNFPAASNQPPGMAVAGPASLQTAPNNMAPIVKLSIASDGTISATNLIGQVGCGQKC